MKKIKLYLTLFLVFAKIGVMAFGGGYAILPILQKELVEKREWVSKKKLGDYFALSQCMPGIIASNVAVFIGTKRGKKLGGIAASLGVVFPSFVIISIVASVLSNFDHIQAVQDAFVAIRACVTVLIIKAILSLWKTSIVDIYTFFISVAVMCCSIMLNVTPIIFVIIAGAIGVLITFTKRRKKS